MINFYNPEMMRHRCREMIEHIHATVLDQENYDSFRTAYDRYSEKHFGCTYSYLKAIEQNRRREPSARVLKNLGMEIWIKDTVTGEMEKVEPYAECDPRPATSPLSLSSIKRLETPHTVVYPTKESNRLLRAASQTRRSSAEDSKQTSSPPST